MPFAIKFRAMMDLPFAGDTIEGFCVESVDVGHRGIGSGRYVYPIRLVLQGVGGQAGVRRALKAMLTSHVTTFSGYGTPYQLWFAKPEVESLGDRRYAVTVEGAGSRFWLDDELQRFLDHLRAIGMLADGPGLPSVETVVEEYIEGYRAEISRKVGRYRSKVKRRERAAEAGSD